MAFQLRRGLDAERTAGGGIVFAEGELVYITDTEEVYVGDGVTPGGIKVTGNVTASPETLTRNLSLGGFDINGTGNININGTISASNITGGGGGLIEGQEYTIDIIGDVKAPDSGLIVDSTNSIVYADFVGDGSLISNISLDQLADVDTTGVATDSILKYDGANWSIGALGEASLVGDLTGSVFGDDSTLIVDGVNNRINTSSIESNTQEVTLFTQTPTSSMSLNITSDDETSFLKLTRTSDSDLAGDQISQYGSIVFGRNDANGYLPTSIIYGRENSLYFGNSADGVLSTGDKYFVWKDNKFGIGNTSPAEVLDLVGSVAIANGSIRFDDNRAIADITDATIGDLKYEANEDSFVFYNSTASWQKVVSTNINNGLTSLDAGIRLGINTQAEIDGFLEDSTLATGAIAYNEEVDRFEFFQAGSWVRLANAGSAIGEVLKWNGEEWSAAPDTGGAEVGSNADFLDGFDGTYYLNYNNFTNTPTLFNGVFASLTSVPTTIAGYGITDAFDGAFGSLTGTPTTLAGYGITDAFDGVFASLTSKPTTVAGYGITDAVLDTDLGNFTFTASVLDSSDSSGITITPAVIISSDLTVENNLTVTNTLVVDTIEVNNLITAAGAGTPEISSETDILLTAANRVEITSSPLRMASFTTAERDAIVAQDGDIIYNTTDNKFQGYENGAWANLI